MTSHDEEAILLGTILKRDLDGLPGLAYSHVGVYVGLGRVIHFNGAPGAGTEATIEETSLHGFSKGRRLSELAVPESEGHGAAIAAEARRVLSAPHSWNGRYNAAFRNCEDFAQHCFEVHHEGRKASPPWSQRARTIVAGLSAVVVAGVTIMVGSKVKRPPLA